MQEMHSDLDSDLSAIVARTAEGWEPEVPPLAAPAQVSWGDRTYSGDCLEITLEEGFIRGVITLGNEPIGDAEAHMASLRGALAIKLEDGANVTATSVFPTNVTYRHRAGKTQEIAITFLLDHWNWTNSRQPQLWWSQFTTHSSLGGGNLNISANANTPDGFPRFHSARHHWFSGTSPALVIRRKPDKQYACVVIGDAIEHWLHFDRYLLEFAFGTRLGLHQFYALDKSGAVVGISVFLGGRKPTRGSDREVVPRETVEPWIVDFFNLLVERVDDDDGMMRALLMYVDSIGDTITGCVLKMFACLSLLARLDSKRSNGNSPWHEEISSALTRHNVPTSQLLERALKEDIYSYVSTITRAANSEDLARLTDIRSAIYRLAARHIGYHGPFWVGDKILAGDPESLGVPKVTNKRIQAVLSGDETAQDVWPSFEAPEPSENPSIVFLEYFAKNLAPKTRMAVGGALQPQPHTADGTRNYVFKILLRRTPTMQATLFTIRETKKGVEAHGWIGDEKARLLRSLEEVKEFARHVAASKPVRELIERFILIDEELGRGER